MTVRAKQRLLLLYKRTPESNVPQTTEETETQPAAVPVVYDLERKRKRE